jgi:hypothetical protein
MPVQTMRQYLFSVGLTKAPTGRGRFSREAIAALGDARAKGMTFADDAAKADKPSTVRRSSAPAVVTVPKAERPNVDPKAVRKWALDNGHEVGERGRIHSSIIDEYVAAMGESVVERGNEMDVYRDGAPRRYDRDTKFVGTYEWKGQTEKLVVSARSACMNCGVSLVIHTCNSPRVTNGITVGGVAVTPVA